jgi:hypothetical protein
MAGLERPNANRGVQTGKLEGQRWLATMIADGMPTHWLIAGLIFSIYNSISYGCFGACFASAIRKESHLTFARSRFVAVQHD